MQLNRVVKEEDRKEVSSTFVVPEVKILIPSDEREANIGAIDEW